MSALWAASVVQFAWAQTYENSFHQMAVGNFNTADGANEVAYIAAVNNWGGAVTAGAIYVQDFNTGFSQMLPGISAIKVAAGDVNGDGRDDVVYINSANQLGYYDFATNTNTLVPTGLTFQDITTANIDGDAQVEIYTSDAGTSLRFYDAVTNSFTGVNGAAGEIIRANLDGDAFDEVAVRNGANNASGMLYVNTNPPGAGFIGLGGGLNLIAAGNLDASDAFDEIYLTNSANNIYTHRVNTGGFAQTTGAGTDPTVGHPETFGDGRDLAYIIGSGDTIYQGTTTWNLASGPTMTYTALRQTASNDGSAAVLNNGGYFDIIAADIDADGNTELLGRRTADGGTSFYLFKNGTTSLVQQNVFLTQSDIAGSSSFDTAGNWSNGQAPQAGINYDVGSGQTLRTPNALNPAAFAGDSLNVYTGGTLSLDHTGTATVGVLNLDGGTIAQSSGSKALAGSINLTSDSTFNVAAGSLDVQSTVSGGGGLMKTGAGALKLGGVASYTGATNVSAGTLTIQQVGSGSNNGNIGAGPNTQLTTSSINVSSGATAILDTGANFSSSNTNTTLSGAGTIRLASGTWWLGNGG
ncbi:MAG: autotransporter-associated beta strand repeat-containing protein, partial [Planctomycetales bacterium]|nr:autotransporter-associated beta strand repeat-containing protein [Planctomycetales bacterium]